MMDPLSVTSNGVVARAATSVAALASTLYDRIAGVRGPQPPREMKEVAGGVRDLSSGLRELRNTLQKVDRGVFRSGFFASIHSVAGHVEQRLEEIPALAMLDDDGDADADVWRVSRTSWKARMGEVLSTLDSLKLAVGLITSMMLLVWEQDKRSVWKHDREHQNEEEDERLFLRKHVETLIQATKQSIKDASSPRPTHREVAAQTDERHQSPLYATNPADGPPATAEQPPTIVIGTDASGEHQRSMELERREQVPQEEDAARWLYRFIFGDVIRCNPSQDDVHAKHVPIATLVSESSKISRWQVTDRLLRSWSRLNEDEIQELRALSSSPNDGKNTATQDHGHDLMRASVHQMVSKALSYGPSNVDRLNRGDKPNAQFSSRRRTSQDDYVAHRPSKVDSGESGDHKRQAENQKDGNPGDRPTPPLQPQHASHHRSRPASWVLGPRSARSRSSEGRGANLAASISSSSSSLLSLSSSSSAAAHSRFIRWRSPETPVVSHFPPSSSSNKQAQHSPPQKVLFTSPVARLGSSTTGNTTAATTRRSSTSSSTTTTARIISSSSPPTQQPTKSILKLPTHHFPEEPNPVREGVTPHRSDKTKGDAPPGAKWTKIKRSWVNPEALAIGKERFEVLRDHVKVLRVLNREEIEAYRIATAQLRAMREEKEQQQEQQQGGKLAGTGGMRATRERRRSGSGSKEEEGIEKSRTEGDGGRYRTRRERSPSPRRRRESGDVPWAVVARST